MGICGVQLSEVLGRKRTPLSLEDICLESDDLSLYASFPKIIINMSPGYLP